MKDFSLSKLRALLLNVIFVVWVNLTADRIVMAGLRQIKGFTWVRLWENSEYIYENEA